MLCSRNGRQPRGVKGCVQVGCALGPLTVLMLSGCSSLPGSMNPVNWWHDLQGGKIAEERPPPPGADQPYPNLASVPAKPSEPDRAALTNVANALIADRTNAQHFAASTPLADPSSPSASPALFGRGTAAPPGPAATPAPATAAAKPAGATLPGAEPPPLPKASAEAEAAPPAKAPVGAVQSSPLAPPAASQSAAEAVPLAPPGATAQPAPEAPAPPPLPTAPPPAPNLPGVAAVKTSPVVPQPTPAPAAAPTPPPAPAPTTVASASPAPAPNAANSVSVTFITGSAELPSFGAASLKQLAARRGNGIIAVTGYGDAASDDPDAQSAALALGLSRAQAMAAALTSAGVPASAVAVDAQAIGRGGTARLVQ